MRLPQSLAAKRVAFPTQGAFAAASQPQVEAAPTSWRFATLTGRLTELSSPGGTAALTLAFSMVLDAQQAGEPVGWVTDDESIFFPPDVARGGIDLEALVVVRLSVARQIPRAAEHLARSGAFGLLVLDLGDTVHVPLPMQMRLRGLAQKHESALLFLTRKRRDAGSLGTLVSLRAEARREPVARPAPAEREVSPTGNSVFTCTAQVLKDKRGGPGWRYVEVCCGPDGLC
ncbi:MAG: recombinase A [Acidobacteriota bacterium]|nr:recombinase A [Acidobacteriota bacterium]